MNILDPKRPETDEGAFLRRHKTCDIATNAVAIELETPQVPAAPCAVCGNPIFWEDPYGQIHCGGCQPAPSAALCTDAWVVVAFDDGLEWENCTDRLQQDWLLAGN